MPEGHSIHRLARQMNDVFARQKLEVSSPQGRFVDGAKLLDGQVMERAFAHGKHLFLAFEHQRFLDVHLGIYGAWTFGGDSEFAGASSIGAPRKVGEREQGSLPSSSESYLGPPPPTSTVRARLVSEHGWADLVGPTVCRVLTATEVESVRAQLGPDPLNDDASPQDFLKKAQRTARPIGAVLMDQKVISGVGNIFRAESLFRCGVNPMVPAKELSEQQLLELWEDNRKLMNIGVRVGRIITTTPQDRPGTPEDEAWPEYANYVYLRHGKPCRHCGTEVRLEELNGRKLYWCPRCQPAG